MRGGILWVGDGGSHATCVVSRLLLVYINNRCTGIVLRILRPRPSRKGERQRAPDGRGLRFGPPRDVEWPGKRLSITQNTISRVHGSGANGCFHREGNLVNGKVDGSITRDGITEISTPLMSLQHTLQMCSCPQISGGIDASEDVFEVLHAVRLEEHQQDERPQAQDEAVRRMPVLLLRFLRGGAAG
ncbi:hypothetical protein EYF80_001318 [Liparis tanakae]|uniref:Uncharacterized protein n=1 Tax=Liparis tanakae TaxID=230148 RepID=A0A4Z2JE33_9TELE|nr:hypothetical protein EYF80_001318 [Liparis tanakae]